MIIELNVKFVPNPSFLILVIPNLLKSSLISQFFLEKESFIVIVVSSTGDGDAPENCSRFVRRIARKGLPEDALARLEYAILGRVFHFGYEYAILGMGILFLIEVSNSRCEYSTLGKLQGPK